MLELSAYHINSDNALCYSGLPVNGNISIEHHNGSPYILPNSNIEFPNKYSYEVYGVGQYGLLHNGYKYRQFKNR